MHSEMDKSIVYNTGLASLIFNWQKWWVGSPHQSAEAMLKIQPFGMLPDDNSN